MFCEWLFFPIVLIILIIAFLIILRVQYLQDKFLKQEEKNRIKEGARRIEDYFKRWPEVWRLYEYARDCGYGFKIQSADEALDNVALKTKVWAAVFPAERNNEKFNSRDKPEYFVIIVPLDVLRIEELQQYENFVFAKKILRELLAGLPSDNVEFLEKLWIQYEKLADAVKEAQKNIFGKNLFGLGHEIGHLKIAEDADDEESLCYSCRLLQSMASRPTCFLNELRATLRGLEVINELGLREILEEKFVVEGKADLLEQCESCQAEIKEGRCPAKEKINEVLTP